MNEPIDQDRKKKSDVRVHKEIGFLSLRILGLLSSSLML